MTIKKNESTNQDGVRVPLARPLILPASGNGLENRFGKSGESARRRLVKSALAAGPVVLTLRGQSALAGTGCASPSRIFSGNLSPGHTPPPCGTGWSPGYWKVCQHFDDWAAAPSTSPGTFSGTCTSGMPGTQLTPGTLFGELAPFTVLGTAAGTLGGFSAWRILAYPTKVDAALALFNINQIQLARHLIASYLNFKKVGPTFPLTIAHMTDMWVNGSVDQYCPLGTGCTPAQKWTAQQVVCYLRNYTMDQASLSTDPVTWVCTGI